MCYSLLLVQLTKEIQKQARTRKGRLQQLVKVASLVFINSIGYRTTCKWFPDTWYHFSMHPVCDVCFVLVNAETFKWFKN